MSAARRRGENLWRTAASSDLSFLLLSPEQLVSSPFNTLLHNSQFRDRLVALGVDELHLVLDWGSSNFRKAFRDIGLMLACMPSRTTLIGVTATLLAGHDIERLMDVLTLKPGSFFFTRRSNRRSEVRFIMRKLRHGLQGSSFPDLKWIVEGNRKTIVYCSTVNLAYRLFVYLLHSAGSSDPATRRKRIRLHCSLYPDPYNEKTVQLLFFDQLCCQ